MKNSQLSRLLLTALTTGLLAACRRTPEDCFYENMIAGPHGGCVFPAQIQMSVAPHLASIFVGGTLQMSDSIISPTNVQFAIDWTSSNPAQASVDSTGLVTGRLATAGVAICATASKEGYDSYIDCGTIVVSP
jgi:hypothetical protein